ncbi:tetratricopeptide repeat protein [Streptomyces sp. NPDC003362]
MTGADKAWWRRSRRASAGLGGSPHGAGHPGQRVGHAVVHGPVVQVEDVSGDVHITVAAEPLPYVLAAFPLRPAPLAADEAFARPSQLLHARHALVDFAGRRTEQERLESWRDDAAQLSVLLVHAVGGQGKTRLAAHFAARCDAEGWDVWHASHLGESLPTPDSGSPPTRGRGVLVVIDYAERWPYPHLLRLLQDPALPTRAPVRVLALARLAGTWWDGLRHQLTHDLSATAETLPLPPLGRGVEDRGDLFRSARKAFAAAMGVREPDSAVPDLRDDAYGNVLTVHMAALAAVDAGVRGLTAPSDAGLLSAYLLANERRRWRDLYTVDPHLWARPEVMARAVYSAVLTGPQSYDDAVAVLSRAGIASTAEGAMHVIDSHARMYPPADTFTAWLPLQPDRLSEDFLALQTPGHAVAGHEADPWAAGVAERLLAAAGPDGAAAGPPPFTSHAVQMLIEVSRRWPHVARHQLYPLLRDHPTIALAAGDAALTRLAEIEDLDVSVLEALLVALPEANHSGLDAGMAALTTRYAAFQAEWDVSPERLAAWRRQQSYRLLNVGRYEDAEAVGQDAVRVFRELVRTDGVRHEPALASALVNTANATAHLGEHGKTLALTEEAVAIRRRLAAEDSEKYEADLAMALSNLAVSLWRSKAQEQGIGVVREVVDIYRRLSARDPAEHEASLATALTNLGAMLADAGETAAAVEVAQEAVALFRRLATAEPATHNAGLAAALTNLAGNLSQSGHTEEALGTADEAFVLYDGLVAANPSAYEPDLARLLTNVAHDLRVLGRYDVALPVAAHAVEIYVRQVAVNPDGSEAILAETMAGLAGDLSSRKSEQEAVAATALGLTLYRRLAAEQPAMYSSTLARLLTAYTARLLLAGVLEDALEASREAVQVGGLASEYEPTAFEPERAKGLEVFAFARLVGEVELGPARQAAERSVTAYRTLWAERGAEFADPLREAESTLRRITKLLQETASNG